MNIHKLRKLDQSCAGVTLPKDDLLIEGIVNEAGDLVKQPNVVVERVDDGEWRVALLQNEFPGVEKE